MYVWATGQNPKGCVFFLMSQYSRVKHMRLSDCLGFCVCGMKVSDRMFTMNMCEYFLCKSLATKVKLSEVRLQKCVCVLD